METPSLAKKAYRLALRRLGTRETSRLEMREYLAKREIPEDIAEATIQELVDEGSLSDERYTGALIRTLVARGKGPVHLQMALRKKGIEKSLPQIKAILGVEVNDWDEAELARRTVTRRYPEAATDPKAYHRAYRALLRRGFSAETIRKCLGKYPKK